MRGRVGGRLDNSGRTHGVCDEPLPAVENGVGGVGILTFSTAAPLAIDGCDGAFGSATRTGVGATTAVGMPAGIGATTGVGGMTGAGSTTVAGATTAVGMPAGVGATTG